MAAQFAENVEWTVKYATGPVDDPFHGNMTVYADEITGAAWEAEKELPDDALILTIECEDY